jgi:transposase
MADIDTQDARTSDPPLDHDEAARLDERIRRMAKATKGNLDALNDLIEKAKAGQIHTALGYDSWTAYLTDAVGELSVAVDSDTRREIAVILYHYGMSIRDAAKATGQSKSKVHREVSQSGTVDGSAETTVGHDGKVRQRKASGSKDATSQRRSSSDRSQNRQALNIELERAKSSIEFFALNGKAAELQTEICKLIGELLAAIQPATESN